MGWNISNIDNDVKLSKAQALELAKTPEYLRIVGDSYTTPKFDSDAACLSELFEKFGSKYLIIFNPDHMEHMDYVSSISKILNKIKAKGDITFGSMDGDNSGEFWGYRFDGKGGMKKLVGNVTFFEEQ